MRSMRLRKTKHNLVTSIIIKEREREVGKRGHIAVRITMEFLYPHYKHPIARGGKKGGSYAGGRGGGVY